MPAVARSDLSEWCTQDVSRTSWDCVSGWSLRATSTLSQVDRFAIAALKSGCMLPSVIGSVSPTVTSIHSLCPFITDSKEGADSDLDKYLPEADIVITTPFHPGYINADRIAKAPKLKLALTAGIGSDHVDLPAAAEHGVTVAEITGELLSLIHHTILCCPC